MNALDRGSIPRQEEILFFNFFSSSVFFLFFIIIVVAECVNSRHLFPALNEKFLII